MQLLFFRENLIFDFFEKVALLFHFEEFSLDF